MGICIGMGMGICIGVEALVNRKKEVRTRDTQRCMKINGEIVYFSMTLPQRRLDASWDSAVGQNVSPGGTSAGKGIHLNSTGGLKDFECQQD